MPETEKRGSRKRLRDRRHEFFFAAFFFGLDRFAVAN